MVSLPRIFAASGDDHGRVRKTHLRVYSLAVAGSICAVFLLIGLLVPILVLDKRDHAHAAADEFQERVVSEHWADVCRNAVVSTLSAAFCLQGFIVGEVRVQPRIRGPTAAPVAHQFFTRFPLLADMVNVTTEELSLLATAPSGIIFQMQPFIPAIDRFDLLHNTNALPKLGTADPFAVIAAGNTVVLGPRLRRLVSLDGNPRWDIDVMQPIYDTAMSPIRDNTSFWGFSYAILSFTAVMVNHNLTAYMEEKNMDYLIYTRNEDETAGEEILVVASSLPEQTSQADLYRFKSQATKRNILISQMDWFIAVKARRQEKALSSRNLAIIVSCVVGGTLVLFLVNLAVVLLYTQEYNGRQHAPKRPPFAILTLGPCHGEELWNLASDQMVEVTERLNLVLARAMAAHCAYPVPQLHPYTSSYVARSVPGAIDMAFAVLEELQARPIDGSLVRLLGHDGRLLVSCAVHWCTEATVTAEPGGRSLRFEGPDVVFGSRMWFFSAANTVTLSVAARDSIGARLAESATVAPHSSVYLRGVRGKQDLFSITDPASRRLREARESAVARVLRFRQMLQQRQNGPGDSGDNPHHQNHNRAGGAAASSSGNSDSSFSFMPAFIRNNSATDFTTSSSHSTTTTSNTGGRGTVIDRTASSAYEIPLGSGTTAVAPDGRVMLSRPRKRGRGSGGVPTRRVSLSTTDNGSSSNTNSGSHSGGGFRGPPINTTVVVRTTSPMLGPATPGSALAGGGEASRTTPLLADGHPLSDTSAIAIFASADAPPSVLFAIVGRAAATRARMPSSTIVPATASGGTTATAATGGTDDAQDSGEDPLGESAAASGSGSYANPLVQLHHSGHPPRGASRPPHAGPPNTRHVDVPGRPVGASPTVAASAAAARGGSIGSGGGPLPGFVAYSSVPVFGATASGGLGHLLPSVATTTTTTTSPRASTVTLSRDIMRTTTTTAAEDDEDDDDGDGVGRRDRHRHRHRRGGHREQASPDPAVVARELLHPSIPVWLDAALRVSYEHHAGTLDISYDSIRVLMYYVFSCYKLLFRPLTPQEKNSIHRRLVVAFGVPQRNILENLAARCVVLYMQQRDESKPLFLEARPYQAGEPAADKRRKEKKKPNKDKRKF